VIRELRQEDADAAARLGLAVNPHRIETGELIWYRATKPPPRALHRDWVAELDGRLVGHAFAGLERSGANPGKSRFWIGVDPDHRSRGIGTALYRTVEEHLRSAGAQRLRTWVDGDPAGQRFVRERGFELTGADRVAEVDPRTVDLSRLPKLEANGLRLASLAETLDRVEALFERCRAGRIDLPDDLVEWKWDELEHPSLSREGSFVVLEGEQPVSLGFLTVDPERRVAYNLLTATLPGYRRRGLGLLVKLATTRWAAANGIERLLTENDRENVAVLALNDSLGYRPLYDQGIWVLER
jgi:GNAT superfamily N-acetyltransferase